MKWASWANEKRISEGSRSKYLLNRKNTFGVAITLDYLSFIVLSLLVSASGVTALAWSAGTVRYTFLPNSRWPVSSRTTVATDIAECKLGIDVEVVNGGGTALRTRKDSSTCSGSSSGWTAQPLAEVDGVTAVSRSDLVSFTIFFVNVAGIRDLFGFEGSERNEQKNECKSEQVYSSSERSSKTSSSKFYPLLPPSHDSDSRPYTNRCLTLISTHGSFSSFLFVLIINYPINICRLNTWSRS